MKSKSRSGNKGKYKIFWRSLKYTIIVVVTILSIPLLFNVAVQLPRNSQSSTDGVLVLGGSISREIYAAKLAKQNPEIPILIAKGSQDPCIYLVFQRAKAPTDNLWLEICSDSTFTNFIYGIPVLRSWNVHKVKLITSGTHIRRSKWMAKIILGSQGMWVDLTIAPEKGVPGNTEFLLKTAADLTRSVLWAFLGQVVEPFCSQVYPLNSVDWNVWRDRDFSCERQGGFDRRELTIEEN